MEWFKKGNKFKTIRNNLDEENLAKFQQQLDQWNSAKQDTKYEILKFHLKDLRFEETTKTNKLGNQNVVCGWN